DKGILHEFTTPYAPEQNGVAERLNRTIMEAARSMLYQAKLPLQFWAEACSTAVYLHNRSPTSAIKDQTPFERLFGIKPDISNLRVFGCVAYMHVPDSQRKKLDAKARRTIFIGYPPGVKGYKLYDLEKGAFFISRNVKFFEDQFNESRDESESYQFLPASSILPEADEEAEIIPQVPIDAGNAEPVGEPQVPLRRQTFEDAFMEQVSQLGPVRQRRPPARYDEECLLMDSLTTEIDEPNSVEEALHGEHSVQWKEAMQSEYSSLLKNETWELVPPPERTNVVGSRWVLKVKRGEDGSVDRFKARLVAQGFSQTKGVDYDEVFSPVVRQTSVRTLLALANAQDYEVHPSDVLHSLV
ncbi:MAG: reverse transcriptase domain-containing protein, partial [Bacteroidota bacterium]